MANLKLAVWGLCNGCSGGFSKYIYSFNVNGSPLGSLPSQTPYTTNSPLTSITLNGNPAYTGNVADNNANAYLSFGNNVSSVSFNVQGTASMVIDSINFDYGTTVNAPIDLKETSQLKTFASEIEVK